MMGFVFWFVRYVVTMPAEKKKHQAGTPRRKRQTAVDKGKVNYLIHVLMDFLFHVPLLHPLYSTQ